MNTVSVQKMYNGENGIHKYMCTLSTHFTEITLHTLLKYFDCTYLHRCFFPCTVVPALGDPRRERPPAVCGHFVNAPTHFKVKLPVISGHLPNADADSHLLVVSTCYNGQYKQMPRFPWSFQPKIARAHPNLRPTDLSNFRAVVW